MDEGGRAVGRVLGTADATPLQFWVAVQPGAYLQLDDVVVTTRVLPDRRAGDDRRRGDPGTGPARGRDRSTPTSSPSPTARCPPRCRRRPRSPPPGSSPEIYVPPAPGALVRRASGAERDGALYFDRMERRIPIGHRAATATPLYLNADFLDGTRGAHVSISGISGVATKTSFATLLLYSVFRSGVLGGAGDTANTRALIFNVKGEDLLFLDHPNTRLDARHATRRTPGSAWTPAPFPDVRVYAPPRAGDRTGAPDVASRLTGVDAFYWTLAEFCADRLLPYVFADADDDRQQYTMVVHSVAALPGPARRAGRRRGQSSTAAGSTRTPTWSTSSSSSSVRRGHPRPSGPAARSAWARSTRSCDG